MQDAQHFHYYNGLIAQFIISALHHFYCLYTPFYDNPSPFYFRAFPLPSKSAKPLRQRLFFCSYPLLHTHCYRLATPLSSEGERGWSRWTRLRLRSQRPSSTSAYVHPHTFEDQPIPAAEPHPGFNIRRPVRRATRTVHQRNYTL